MILDRTALLARAAESRKLLHDVDVPEIGTIRVQKLSASEVTEYLAENKKHDGDDIHMMAWLTVKAGRAEDGSPLFTLADLPEIKDMPFPALKAISTKVAKVSGIAKADAEKKAESAS